MINITCIVGYIEDGVTWIGGDSLGSNGYSKTVRKDTKVFKMKDLDHGIIGYTSSFRMGQLLQYESLIDPRDENIINHEYLVTKFIPKVIECLEEGGYSEDSSGRISGGTFLLGYKDKLYRIENDYQVGESQDDFDACGSGEYFALGALETMKGEDIQPKYKVLKALRAASKFSTGVAPPYIIANTKGEVNFFKD